MRSRNSAQVLECLPGGLYDFFHHDAHQEMPATGIMAYDPNVKSDHRAAVRRRFHWLGIDCKLINKQADRMSEMVPHHTVVPDGKS
ncbi:MAG: hypothetical protein P8K08_09245 [Fuerstiella sp.]|nr:hypothetical protein [Fuerstiella sp.]